MRNVCVVVALVGVALGIPVSGAAQIPNVSAGDTIKASDIIEAVAWIMEQPSDCTPIPHTFPDSSNVNCKTIRSPQNGLNSSDSISAPVSVWRLRGLR